MAERGSARNAEEEPCRVSDARAHWSRTAEIVTRAECRSVRAAREVVWMRQVARPAGIVAVQERLPVNCAGEHTASLVRSVMARALCPTTASCATAGRSVLSAAEQDWQRSKKYRANTEQQKVSYEKGDTTAFGGISFLQFIFIAPQRQQRPLVHCGR